MTSDTEQLVSRLSVAAALDRWSAALTQRSNAMSDDNSNVIQLRPSPDQVSDTGINSLWDYAVSLMHQEARRLCPETIFHEPAEAPMLSTRKRHLPDILECRNCDYQFPREASCPKCGSTNLGVYMHAPSRAEIRDHTLDREEVLNELDPDWRERFGGDEERAWAFYKTPVIELPATSAERELDEAIDEALFDADLEDRNEHS